MFFIIIFMSLFVDADEIIRQPAIRPFENPLTFTLHWSVRTRQNPVKLIPMGHESAPQVCATSAKVSEGRSCPVVVFVHCGDAVWAGVGSALAF
jgi:hypothetical protein